MQPLTTEGGILVRADSAVLNVVAEQIIANTLSAV